MLNRQLDRLRKTMIIRLFNTNGTNQKSSTTIRKEFLDYFTKELNHTYVPSSPVLPMNDPTLPFVNSGMNQFKGVFLGNHNPPAIKVANSQKCIRVGGKHNDLEAVGLDTYHHTFFEMLGSWSFGNYFKAEACEYAWNLLTGPYGMKKEHLYISYFGGDEKLGLKADLETKDIWQRLGVPEDRILPFGLQDNFWEMGVSGPCGPCTEIHVDHTMQTSNQSSRVNKGYTDLTELWNLVFIQYQRLEDGTIVPLDKCHVDTGMGFERLVAILQGKRSNYDTDLFTPLFKAIEKLSGLSRYEGRFAEADKNSVDTGYRILADHARMVTVALADGIIPEHNHKLRRVLRKALTIGEEVFRRGEILRELTNYVAETLGDVYPEIQKNLNQVQRIIEYEDELRKSLKSTITVQWQKMIQLRPALAAVSDLNAAGLVAGYNELQKNLGDLRKTGSLTGDFAFKLYDTYGLGPDTIAELAAIESLSFDSNDFVRTLDDVKLRSKIASGQIQKNLVSETSLRQLETKKVPKTDDTHKYRYEFGENGYIFPPVNAKIQAFIVDGNLVSETEQPFAFDEDQVILKATVAKGGNVVAVNSIIDTSTQIGIILDKTAFYTPEGGQLSDKGFIKIGSTLFEVEKVYKIRGYVVHVGRFVDGAKNSTEVELHIGEDCLVAIDGMQRTALMRNHTSTHLLNAALRKVLPVISQRASIVTKENLIFQFNIFGENVNTENIISLEKLINDCIANDVPVITKVVDMTGLLGEKNLTLIPGEVYPDTQIRIVEIDSVDLKSKEACCGTHVHKTGVLEDFCILNVKSQGTTSRTIKAVAGPLARLARFAGESAKQAVNEIEKEFESGNVQSSVIIAKCEEMKRQLNERSEKTFSAYISIHECLDRLAKLLAMLRERETNNMKISMEAEMKSVVHATTMPFVVHCLQPVTTTLDEVSLQRLTKLCSKTPVLVIAHTSGKVKARCCVPKEMVTSSFNALLWMNAILPIFKGHGGPSMGHDPTLVYHMSVKRVQKKRLGLLVEEAIAAATKFAAKHVNQTKHETS